MVPGVKLHHSHSAPSCGLPCHLALFAASPPSSPPLHGVLMGKVYFYALDLARISTSQALLMGKVPTTKLDLARSGPTKWNSGSLPENASRSGDTEGRARKGRSTAAPPPLGGRSGGYNQAGCGEQHPRRALLAGLLLPAARGVVGEKTEFKDLPRTPRPHPATPARRKRRGGRAVKGRLDELWWSGSGG